MKLPPLNALRAFDAAARHQSYVKAGQELGVSASAVSRHIRQLEEHFRAALFERNPNGVRLTTDGARYFSEVSPLIQGIAEASDLFVTQRRSTRIFAAPTIALRWLMPRYAELEKIAPTHAIEVGLFTVNFDEFWIGGYTIGVGYERAIDQSDPRLTIVNICGEILTPLCAPELGRRLRRKDNVDLLRDYTIGHPPNSSDWDVWFDAFAPSGRSQQNAMFSSGESSVHAAMAGHCVAIGDLRTYARELEARQLVAPFPELLDRDAKIQLFFRADEEDDDRVSAIRDYLLQTFGRPGDVA